MSDPLHSVSPAALSVLPGSRWLAVSQPATTPPLHPLLPLTLLTPLPSLALLVSPGSTPSLTRCSHECFGAASKRRPRTCEHLTTRADRPNFVALPYVPPLLPLYLLLSRVTHPATLTLHCPCYICPSTSFPAFARAAAAPAGAAVPAARCRGQLSITAALTFSLCSEREGAAALRGTSPSCWSMCCVLTHAGARRPFPTNAPCCLHPPPFAPPDRSCHSNIASKPRWRSTSSLPQARCLQCSVACSAAACSCPRPSLLLLLGQSDLRGVAATPKADTSRLLTRRFCPCSSRFVRRLRQSTTIR